MDMGNGAGLTQRVVGQTGGETSVTLALSQIPAHNHQVLASASAGTTNSPAAAAGLKPGDVIMQLGVYKVATLDGLLATFRLLG